jgi:hypothetical protein
MRTHAAFRRSGVLSLFLGDLRSDAQADKYLRKRFATDFGFAINPADGPEVFCRETPAAVRELLEGFSCATSFIDLAAKGAADVGWPKANCAVVFYNFAFEATTPHEAGRPLTFIGVFHFESRE